MSKRRSGSSSQMVLGTIIPPEPPNSLIGVLTSGSESLRNGSEPSLASGGSPPSNGWEPLLAARGRWFGIKRPDAGSYHPEGEDVRALPAALWGRLPLSASLGCQSHYSPLPLTVTCSRAVWLALRRRKAIVFGVLEWMELVSSFENERANPASFLEWCEFKRKAPTWKLSKREALGGVIGDARREPLVSTTVGAVLDAWGVELCAVTYGEAIP
jgi:hypothetical protein